MRLSIDAEGLEEKLRAAERGVDLEQIQAGIQNMVLLEDQMNQTDSRIKALSNRAENEIKPSLKAVNLVENNYPSIV